jgi:hypothetical protein
MKAEKHYQEWPLEECQLYFKRYLSLIKNKDVKVVRQMLADEFGRTRSAIGFKEREVIGVLTEGQEGIYTYGDNMVTATMEALEESGLSKSRFRMWFE